MSRTEDDASGWIGETFRHEAIEPALDMSDIARFCQAVGNRSSIHWDPEEADAVCGGVVAPASLLPSRILPVVFSDEDAIEYRPLELHEQLKEHFQLSSAVIASMSSFYLSPMRLGDRVDATEEVLAIGDVKQTRLGVGRRWKLSVEYRRTVDASMFGRDVYSMYAYNAKGS